MTLKALRTQAALKLAPWLKPERPSVEVAVAGYRYDGETVTEWMTDEAPFASPDEIDEEIDELLKTARAAIAQAHPMAASGIYERVQALRNQP